MLKYIIRIHSVKESYKVKCIFEILKKIGTIKSSKRILFDEKNNIFEYILKIAIVQSNVSIWMNLKNKGFSLNIIKYVKVNQNTNKRWVIKYILKEITHTDILNEFKKFGKIKKIYIWKSKKYTYNIAFVTFFEPSSAKNLLKNYASHYIKDSWVCIKYKKKSIVGKKKVNHIMNYKSKDSYNLFNDDTLFKFMKKNKTSHSCITFKKNLKRKILSSKFNYDLNRSGYTNTLLIRGKILKQKLEEIKL